jgi:ribosomal-protein-serine acetyltransferase
MTSTASENSTHPSDNLYLKIAAPAYASDLFKLIEKHKAYFAHFMDWPNSVHSKDDTAEFLATAAKAYAEGLSATYIILWKNVCAGTISLNAIDRTTKTAYLGYWLDKDLHGNGIVSMALKIITEYHSTDKSIERFKIKCSISNMRSNNVALRNGFAFEGVLPEAEVINGTAHDQNVYSKIIVR